MAKRIPKDRAGKQIVKDGHGKEAGFSLPKNMADDQMSLFLKRALGQATKQLGDHPPEQQHYTPRSSYNTELRSDAWLPEWRAFVEAFSTITEAAEALGLSTITLRRWGTGRQPLRYQQKFLIVAVAKARGIKPPVDL